LQYTLKSCLFQKWFATNCPAAIVADAADQKNLPCNCKNGRADMASRQKNNICQPVYRDIMQYTSRWQYEQAGRARLPEGGRSA
jgi:hypothetical protein